MPAGCDEKELLNQCIAGRADAWHRFIERYSSLIYFAIHAVMKSRSPGSPGDEINDLHNDVLLSLMEKNGRKLRQYEGKNGCTVSTWIRVIAVRMTIDHLRKQKDEISVSDQQPRPQPEPAADGGSRMLDALEEKEKQAIMDELIAELPARDRFFLRLFYYERVPTPQIASLLKTTNNAVYSKAHYIKDKLKAAVEKKVSQKKR